MPERPKTFQAKDLSPAALQALRRHVEEFRETLKKETNEIPILDLTPFLIDLFRFPFNNIPLTAEAVRQSGVTELFPNYQESILSAVIDAQLLQSIDPKKPRITFASKHFVVLDAKTIEVRVQVDWLKIQKVADDFHEKFASKPFLLDTELYLRTLNDVFAKMPKKS